MKHRDDWTERERQRWQEIVDLLDEEFPPGGTVRIWWWNWKEQSGDANEYPRGGWLIRIARRLDFSDAVYALAEEWAHLLTWHFKNEDDHGSSWGEAYSTILREIDAQHNGFSRGEE